MNGLISRPSMRFTLVATACLLSGFVSGANFKIISLGKFFPKEEINYSKISWISSSFEDQKVSIAKIKYQDSKIDKLDIKLAEFHLPSLRKPIKNTKKYSHSNFQKLETIVGKINAFDLFEDYRIANEKMQTKFLFVMNSPKKNTDSILLAASSANLSETPKITSPIINPVSTMTVTSKKKITKMNTQKMSIHINNKLAKPIDRIVIQEPKKLEPTTPESVQTVKSSVLMSANIENEALGNKIENQLLEQHIQNYVENKKIEKPIVTASNNNAPLPQMTQSETEIDHNNDVHNIVPEVKHGLVSPIESVSNTCNILPLLHLNRPIPESSAENNQICPTHKIWISKSWGDEGWAKVDTEGYFSFLTYYPQVNTNKALLLDQNSIALLAIKSGVHFAHGMGMILGTVPQGFKIEFSGRAEEIQYFDLNNIKYFIILNVEPGAGVIELISEKNQNENATVFTPVLGDVVTYLDLQAPISVDLPIQIVKNTYKNNEIDNDLNGLTVGISTQTQIQAITQLNGSTILKNVRMVPGYPVFVDVSSKLIGEKSYQYRYQLNKRTHDGVFVLKQYPEKIIYQWLKQINTSLSDQSAMIFGQFNRKRLDGFKRNYTVRVDSLTENFGLIAKNYSVLWDEKLSALDPLEGDRPRFLTVQVPEGLAQARLIDENNQIIQTSLIPVSPRVINVVSE